MGNRGSTGAPWQSGTTGRRRMMNSMPTWAKKQEPTSKKREKEEEEGRRKKKKKPKVNKCKLGHETTQAATQKDLCIGGFI